MSVSESSRLESILRSIPPRAPVLIVTESDGALGAGSIINFVLEQGHVRFAISLAAAERRELVIRSGLLAVARTVITGGP